jgi:two-component system, chemotaxis family, chemotaxis protein CheY
MISTIQATDADNPDWSHHEPVSIQPAARVSHTLPRNQNLNRKRLRRPKNEMPVIPVNRPFTLFCNDPAIDPRKRDVVHGGGVGRGMIRIDFTRLRFLVVEDNAHMRRILRTLLHGFGSREVHEAEDGAAGLEAFVRCMPDIVLTDWAMPIFDGLELTQMIRQPGANANPYVPIIMVTGHSEKQRVVSARDAGVTEFLVKPVSAKSLYQRVLNIVVNPRSFIRSKSYFGPDRRRNTPVNYTGPERRKGSIEAIDQQALLEKMKA